jgi:hypothetical protein
MCHLKKMPHVKKIKIIKKTIKKINLKNKIKKIMATPFWPLEVVLATSRPFLGMAKPPLIAKMGWPN